MYAELRHASILQEYENDDYMVAKQLSRKDIKINIATREEWDNKPIADKSIFSDGFVTVTGTGVRIYLEMLKVDDFASLECNVGVKQY